MKRFHYFSVALIIIPIYLRPYSNAYSQSTNPEEYGFIYEKIMFQNEPIDVLIKTKKGDENKTKPMFLFIQGSLPQPLIYLHDTVAYGTFPFSSQLLTEQYHLVIIGKPGIPIVVDDTELGTDRLYRDRKINTFPTQYLIHNNLEYYVRRNLEIIRQLRSSPRFSSDKLVVAGHSQGSRIGARMAKVSNDITHLIYASGNPEGQIMAMLQQQYSSMDSTSLTDFFNFWQDIVDQEDEISSSLDTSGYHSTYSFSAPMWNELLSFSIPVLVCYGSEDHSALSNDQLRIKAIRAKKENMSFITYYGKGHNFFGRNPDGSTDYKDYNWNKVAQDWVEWLSN